MDKLLFGNLVYKEVGNAIAIVGVQEKQQNVIIPNEINGKKVEIICDCAFMNNNILEQIILPYGLKSIGVNAFSYCENLKNIYVPDSVTDIEHGAFSYCYDLKVVRLSNELKYLSDKLFYHCINLEYVSTCKIVYIRSEIVFHGCEKLSFDMLKKVERLKRDYRRQLERKEKQEILH